MKKSLAALLVLGFLLCTCTLRNRNAVETSVPVAVTATPQTVYTVRHAATSTQV